MDPSSERLAAGIALVQQELDKIDAQVSKELKAGTELHKAIQSSKDAQKQQADRLAELQLENIRLGGEQAELQLINANRTKRQGEEVKLAEVLKVLYLD